MTFKTPPMSLAQAREVARSVHAIRRDWNKPGIEDALGRARHLADPASVAIAAHRAAADLSNRTPAVIALDGAHWRDAAKQPYFPAPSADERCSTCSLREDECRARWAGDHEFANDLRPAPPPAAVVEDQVASLRAIRDTRVDDLCRHHVPPTNCLECSKRSTEPEGAPA